MATAVRPQGAQQPRKLPFTSGTRRRIQTVGSFTVTPGQPLPTITLPQVGMLSKLYLKLEGTITQGTAAATLSPLGYAALMSRIRVSANLGAASIVDASGYGVELANYWYNPSAGPVRNTYGNAAAANQVSYGLVVPINANDRQLLQVGLINLQAEQVRVTLDVTFAQLAAFITAGGGALSSSLTLYVAYEYWDVPDPTRYQLPAPTLVRTLEEQQTITTTGDQIYQVPRLGTLAQLSEYFVFGSAMASLTAPTPQVNQFRIRANKTDNWMTYDARFAEIEEQQFYNTAGGSFMRPGVRSWDFFHSEQQSRNMGSRDLINTEQLTTLEFISTIDASVVPAAGYTRNIVRRVMQRLV